MTRTWIQTLENRKLEPCALRPEMVGSIEEAAHSLAGEYRFTRQTAHYYTVAQHCYLGSLRIADPFKLAFLLHEVSEIYLPDIANPLKPSLRVQLEDGSQITWKELEQRHAVAILEAWGLSELLPLLASPEVKAMDLAMLGAEKRLFMGPQPEPWAIGELPDTGAKFAAWPSGVAEQAFLRQYYALRSLP